MPGYTGMHGSPPQLEIPDRLGRYRILRELGRGGFSVVYLAFDTELDRKVALKVPGEAYAKSKEDFDSIFREARLLARISHQGVLPVFDVGTDAGIRYIVMKFIEGQSLREMLQKGRPSFFDSARIVKCCADALQAVHRHQIYHRDLKPGNILIDQQGQPWVADFGLAITREQLRTTDSGSSGTPRYMSPEQVRGDVKGLDGRTDVWSLGVILYRMLTNRDPFLSDGAELSSEIQFADPPPLRQHDETIPQALESICLRCLCRKASDRYATAHDLARELEAWLSSDDAGQRTMPSRGQVAVEGDTREGLSTPTLQVLGTLLRPRPRNLLVGGIVLGVGILLAGNQMRPPGNVPGSTEVVLKPTPYKANVWYDVLAGEKINNSMMVTHEPKRLLFNGVNPEMFLRQDAVPRLTLISPSCAVAALGIQRSQSFRMSVDIQLHESTTHPNAGNVGMFYGYKGYSAPAGGIQEQCLAVSFGFPKTYPQRANVQVQQIMKDIQYNRIVTDNSPSHFVKYMEPELAKTLRSRLSNNLEFLVLNGRIEQIRVNGALVHTFTWQNPEEWNPNLQTLSTTGSFGVFARLADATFENFRIMILE